jgi:hypothetical protein
MTVSHVLNGTKTVRDQTRAAVLKAVEELGYVPNAAARSLASAQPRALASSIATRRMLFCPPCWWAPECRGARQDPDHHPQMRRSGSDQRT